MQPIMIEHLAGHFKQIWAFESMVRKLEEQRVYVERRMSQI